jgi:hypothetical protein
LEIEFLSSVTRQRQRQQFLRESLTGVIASAGRAAQHRAVYDDVVAMSQLSVSTNSTGT